MMDTTAKKRFFIAMILCALGAACFSQGLKVGGTAPTVGSPYQDAVDQVFGNVKKEIEDKLGNIKAEPRELITAFANSSVYASNSVTQRGYGDYKLFAFTLGTAAGFQIPGDFDFTDLSKLTDTLETKGDIALGANLPGVTGQIGVNASKFLLKDLNLGLRFGVFRAENIADQGIDFDALTLGLLADYRLLPGVNLGFFRWRGVNLGTGFIWQKTAINFAQNLGMKGSLDSSLGSDNVSMAYDPSFSLNLTTNTFTIPLEMTTAARILWLVNLTAGLGADINFGSTVLAAGIRSPLDITVKGSATPVAQTAPGEITVDMGGEFPPDALQLKVIAGVGLTLGPVVLDIPVTYYFATNGYSLGVTLGILW